MKRDAGFTLVEVMVSIVLIAIGLFGLLSMLTTAMSGNRFSYDGTTGVQLAQYMVDQIRVNGGNNNGRYDGMDTDNIAVCNADTVDCGPWRATLLNSGLVNPRGLVRVQTNTPTARTDTIEVWVEWGQPGERRNEIDKTGDGIPDTPTLSTILETWRS